MKLEPLKIIGAFVIFFAFLILFSIYDNYLKLDIIEMILFAIGAICIIAIGTVCWIWDEPYED